MKLQYNNIKDESNFILTNFNCGPSQELLQSKSFYKILWNRSESTSITIDGYQIQLDQHQLVFCTPLNILEIPVNSGIIAIVFNQEFYCIREHDQEVSCHGLLFFGSSSAPMIKLSDKEQESFQRMFAIFEEEFETKDHIQGEMLHVLLKRLLITATRLIKREFVEPDMPTGQFDLIRQYHVLVEQNFREKHQVADYADLLFKSPKTLSNVFKKTGDMSPLKVINERITLEAKRLLLYSDKTAEEIAYELGFKEAAHFSKFFKKQLGTPPATFKKSHKLLVK